MPLGPGPRSPAGVAPTPMPDQPSKLRALRDLVIAGPGLATAVEERAK